MFAQTVWLAPALTTGFGVYVIFIVSDTALQVPLPVVVNIRFTNPAVISAAEGVYVAFKTELLGKNEPPPPDHAPPDAPKTEPFNVTVALFPHAV